MPIVTPTNLRPVEIRSGWLVEQFEKILGWSANWDPHLYAAICKFDEELVKRNRKYNDAWQIDYVITSLADLKDKLYRFSYADSSTIVVDWEPSKLRSTVFDIMARCLMLMSIMEINEQHASEINKDD
jgi:hypothetical protein